MILVGETDPHGRELPFHLPTTADPTVGLTGHAFVLGEIRIRLPGAGYVNGDVAAVVEKGFGDYALVLSPAQVAARGAAYLEVTVAGAQPWSSEEDIGGPIIVGETDATAREVPFHLADSTNPLTPITGHVWVDAGGGITAEVRVYVPGGSGYVNATIANIVEKGYGDYALQLTGSQVAGKGKAYVYAKTASSQQWTSWADIVAGPDSGGGSGGGPTEPPWYPPPTGINVAAYASMMIDLLPPGKLWEIFADSLLYAFFLGCADELGRVDARVLALIEEDDPRTAVELLPEYERELALPSDGTNSERQARATARTIARQRYRPSDFQLALALLLAQAPADVVVLERTAAFAASLGDPREIFRFFVYRDPALAGTYFVDSAQTLVDQIKPSHTIGKVIESIAAKYDDPHSLYDRDLMGA